MNSNRSEAIVNSLSALHDLEVSVRGTRIDDAQILMEKINKFTGNLNDLLQVGKAMDASSMFDVPIEMLAFLEGDISNPELYQYKLYEDTEARATKFAERVLYLQNVTNICKEGASTNPRSDVKGNNTKT